MFVRRKTGWIGADVGNSTVKVVQVVRTARGYEAPAMVAIPRTECWPADRPLEEGPLSSADQFQTARSLRLGLRGRRVAAALPMSACDVQLLDPDSQPTRSRGGPNLSAAVETLMQRPAGEFRYATWPAEPPSNEGPPRENFIAVAADWADQLCSDIYRAGWSCQCVDALPFCLARAVTMVDRRADPGPIAAIDFGYRRATLCVVLAGRPVYVRTLKGCGQQRLLNDLAARLGVDLPEADALLAKHGVAAGNDSSQLATTHARPSQEASPGEAARVIADMLAEPLARLEAEIRRTIDHLTCQRKTIVPEEFILFGGGATIRGLADHLRRRLERDVVCWRLDGRRRPEVEEQGTPTCLFGTAIALSALAWERS